MGSIDKLYAVHTKGGKPQHSETSWSTAGRERAKRKKTAEVEIKRASAA